MAAVSAAFAPLPPYPAGRRPGPARAPPRPWGARPGSAPVPRARPSPPSMPAAARRNGSGRKKRIHAGAPLLLPPPSPGRELQRRPDMPRVEVARGHGGAEGAAAGGRAERRRGLAGMAGRSERRRAAALPGGTAGSGPPRRYGSAAAPRRALRRCHGGNEAGGPSERRRCCVRVGGALSRRAGSAAVGDDSKDEGAARVSFQSRPYRATDAARELELHFQEPLSVPRCTEKYAKGAL